MSAMSHEHMKHSAAPEPAEVPPNWGTLPSGAPAPNWVAAVDAARSDEPETKKAPFPDTLATLAADRQKRLSSSGRPRFDLSEEEIQRSTRTAMRLAGCEMSDAAADQPADLQASGESWYVRGMDLRKRLRSLAANLDQFEPNDVVPWQTALIFNALLEEAKKLHGNDAIVSVIEPVTGDGVSANETVGSMRTSVGQLYEAAAGR